MTLIEIKEINNRNIGKFKIFKFDTYYYCCLCGRTVYPDDSYSNQGDRLICHECYHNKFKTFKDARNWIDRKDESK